MSDGSGPRNGDDRRWRWALPALLALCLGLNLLGIDWGMPNTNPWHGDDVSKETLRALASRFEGFTKYPFVHYLTLAAVYAPYLLLLFVQGEIDTGAQNLSAAFADPLASTTTIIVLGRVVSALMAVGTVALVHHIGRRLTGDRRAALVGAAAYGLSTQTVLFAHMTNVDVPMVFWFAWALRSYLRLVDGGRTRDALLLGLFTAIAVSTKEQIGGAFPLMAVALGVLALRGGAGTSNAPSLRTLLGGLGAFVVAYALLNKLLVDPAGYVERMSGWLSSGTDAATWGGTDGSLSGQIELLRRTGVALLAATGWPLLTLLVVASGFALRDRRAWWIVLPLVSYQALTLGVIHYIYTRFTLPHLLMLALLTTLGMARLLARPGVLRVAAGLLAGVALACGAWRCYRVDRSLAEDPRYRAEALLEAELPAGARVESYAYAHYLPRIEQLDVRHETVPTAGMTKDAFDARAPDAVVLAPEFWHKWPAEPKQFVQWLRTRSGYEEYVFEGPPELDFLGVDDRGRIHPTSIVLLRPR